MAFTDNFTRADSATVGNGWTEANAAVFDIFSNKLRGTGSGAFNTNICHAPAAADFSNGTAVIEFSASAISAIPQMQIRLTPGATPTGYNAYWSGSTFTLARQNGASLTSIQAAAGMTFAVGVNYRITMSADASNLITAVLRNIDTATDMATVSGTDATYTGTAVGVSTHNAGTISYDNFSSTGSGAADTTPDQFTFTDQADVALSTVIVSNAITVLGIDSAATISITGGEYSINAGAYTSASGSVVVNDTVTVRHTSSASNSTATNTVLTIDSVSDTFTSTTLAAAVSTFDFTGAANVFKNNTGTALASRTGIAADVYLASTGDRVGARKTGLTTDASGNLDNIADASYTAVPHTVVIRFAEGEIALVRAKTPA